MAASFDCLSCDEVCKFLEERIPSISKEVLERVKAHKIDGEVLAELNDEYLREIAPLLGDRLKIRRAITASLNESVSLSISV